MKDCNSNTIMFSQVTHCIVYENFNIKDNVTFNKTLFETYTNKYIIYKLN